MLQELDALGGEAVDVGGAYGGAVHAEVSPTEVVGEDEEDVGPVHDVVSVEAGGEAGVAVVSGTLAG
jgi:hypothetical protein